VITKRSSLFFCAGLALAAASCGGTLDAGRNAPRGMLPVDERNPVILSNDNWSDNWMAEYAFLLADDGGPQIVAITVCASNYWPDLNANVAGWTEFVSVARASGLGNVPDITASAGAPLTRPDDGQIDSTLPNRSPGAQRIIDLSRKLARPSRPLVVLVGTQLTDVADAYLIDPSVAERVVVVAELGSLELPKALMTGPNGDLDPWADWIVAQRFRYVQVSAVYDQTGDVTAADLRRLPEGPLGQWIAEKQPDISPLRVAADQVAVLAVALPEFVTAVQRAAPDISAGFGSPPGQGPPLVPDAGGNAWVVTQIAAPLARSQLWRLLLEPR
jgi:hypothetical protein